MITFITHMRVSPENTAAYEAALAEMTAKVRANEPGVAHYGFARSAEDPTTYVVIEVYRDEAAIAAHWETDYIQPSLAKTTPLVDGGAFDVKKYLGD